MNDWLPFVTTGLVIGSVYAIAAMGLVVTYRTTGLFNLGHGAVGMTVAYAFYQLRHEWGVPTPIAILASLLVVAPLIGLVLDRFLFRSLERASQAAKIVVTMGLFVFLQGTVQAIFGAASKRVDPFLPTDTVQVGTLFIGYDQMMIVAIAVAVLVALTVFFRTSRLGLVMRGVVDDRELAEAAGFPVERVTMFTWSLGVVLAGLAGILFSPMLGLDSLTLTLIVLQAALAAAVFGRLVDIPRAFVGALGLGLGVTLSLRLLEDYPELLGGLRTSLPFLFLFAILVFSRRGSLRELGVSAPWAGALRAEAEGWKVLAVALVVFALVVPDTQVFALGGTLVLACAFLSLTLLIGSSGLISLTHAGLVGTGAFAYIHLTNWGVPFPVALVLAGLAAVPIGVAIAIPALRLPGLFLALATFGVGQLLDGLVFSSWSAFSGGTDGLRGTRPDLLTGDRAFAVFLAIMVVLFIVAIGALRRSGLGRALVAMRDSQPAAESLGLGALWPKVAVFVLSAFLAGVAGGLYAAHLQVASKTFFSTFTSLLWVTVVVVGGVQSVYGALAGAFLLAFLPDLVASGDPTEWLTPLFGLGAVLLAARPGGLVGLVARYRPRRLVTAARNE